MTNRQIQNEVVGNAGTVTSVAVSVPARQSVTGSPITGSGTIAISDNVQPANTFFRGPTSGADAAPTFGALVAADLPGSFAGFANPSVSVGLTAKNGSAATAMRSDAAPALDQSISPTWSATHNWSLAGGSGLNLIVSGEGGVTISARRFSANSSAPTFQYRKSRGTIASPSAISQNDDLMSFTAQGRGATTFVDGVNLVATCIEPTPSDTAMGTRFRVLVTPLGSATAVETARWEAATGQTITANDAATSSITDCATIVHQTSGTAAAGFGLAWKVSLENASGSNRDCGRLAMRWITATNGSEDSEWVFSTILAGTLAERTRITPRGYFVSPGNTRVTSDFTSITTTLAAVTGLSVNVTGGKTYHFRAWLPYAADATSGHKYAIDGTATATDVRYRITSSEDATGLTVISSTKTALASAAGQAGSVGGETIIEGTITVNASGALNVLFGLNAGTTTGTIKRGATFIVTEID